MQKRNSCIFLGSAHFPYRVKTKSFQKVCSKLEKIVPQTVIRLFKLTDFFTLLFKEHVFLQTDGKLDNFWVLRQQFGYFLGFSKKKNLRRAFLSLLH